MTAINAERAAESPGSGAEIAWLAAVDMRFTWMRAAPCLGGRSRAPGGRPREREGKTGRGAYLPWNTSDDSSTAGSEPLLTQ